MADGVVESFTAELSRPGTHQRFIALDHFRQSRQQGVQNPGPILHRRYRSASPQRGYNDGGDPHSNTTDAKHGTLGARPLPIQPLDSDVWPRLGLLRPWFAIPPGSYKHHGNHDNRCTYGKQHRPILHK
jgi:hypothetical protein